LLHALRQKNAKIVGGFGSVNEQMKQQYLSALDDLMKKVGVGTFEEGRAIAKGIFLALASKMDELGDRKIFEDKLAQIELSAEEERMIQAIVENLPILLGVLGRSVSQDFAKEFPAPPPTPGRPKSLEQTQKSEVCEFVGKLFSQGTQLGLCKKRAAQKFGVSARTVERIWADRKKMDRKPSVSEMINFLVT
jgi:hypothetical protein